MQKIVSCKSVISKLYRDLNIQDQERILDIVEWIGEAIEQMKIPMQFTRETAVLEIINGNACLPLDFYAIESVVVNNLPIVEDLSSFSPKYEKQANSIEASRLNNILSYRSPRNGYVIENDTIYTTFDSGFATVNYKAIPTDEDGFPMIIDHPEYKEALFWYCVRQMSLPLWYSDQIPNGKWESINANWDRYRLKARGSINMPTLDQMESLKNCITRLKKDFTLHAKQFITANKPGSIY